MSQTVLNTIGYTELNLKTVMSHAKYYLYHCEFMYKLWSLYNFVYFFKNIVYKEKHLYLSNNNVRI